MHARKLLIPKLWLKATYYNSYSASQLRSTWYQLTLATVIHDWKKSKIKDVSKTSHTSGVSLWSFCLSLAQIKEDFGCSASVSTPHCSRLSCSIYKASISGCFHSLMEKINSWYQSVIFIYSPKRFFPSNDIIPLAVQVEGWRHLATCG